MYIVIITTTDSKKSAKEIANTLLEQKLAACIQIEKIKSYYIWEGKINKDKEFRLVIKTKKELFDSLKKSLKAIHPYTTPQIIAIDIDSGNKEYFNWIDEVVKKI